jgi:hypothetical protein
MRTIELPVTDESTPEMLEPDSLTADRVDKPAKYAEAGEAMVYQHQLVRVVGGSRYAETRVVMLSTLEKESQ